MSNPGETIAVCYYSNNCRWCKGFIEAIGQTEFVRQVRFICVDPGQGGKRPPMPAWLKKVPTLVVKGEDEPRTDGHVMNWLSEKKLMAQRKASGAEGPAEPEPWVGNEMGGSFTKGFSFLGANDTNDAPIGNFEFLGGANAPGVRTASDMPNGGLGARAQNKSKKEDLFDKQMTEYMSNRNNGMPPPVMRQ